MQFSNEHWKVAGALIKPKGILSHSQKPSSPTVKAVSHSLPQLEEPVSTPILDLDS